MGLYYIIPNAWIEVVNEQISASSSTLIQRWQLREPLCFRAWYVYSEQTDLLPKNASAEWKCCIPLSFQGSYDEAFELHRYEGSSVCLALTFDVISKSHTLPFLVQFHSTPEVVKVWKNSTEKHCNTFEFYIIKLQNTIKWVILKIPTFPFPYFYRRLIGCWCLTPKRQVFVFPFLKPTVGLFRFSHTDYIHRPAPAPVLYNRRKASSVWLTFLSGQPCQPETQLRSWM